MKWDSDDELEMKYFFNIHNFFNKNVKNPHAVALGKLGGKVKSEKKAESSRENGKLGGRPRKATNTQELPAKS